MTLLKVLKFGALIKALTGEKYRPELYYMRGPGPACRRRGNGITH